MSRKDAQHLTSCVISGSLSLIQHLPVFESLPPVWASLLLCCILQSVPEGRLLESCKRQAQHTCTMYRCNMVHTYMCLQIKMLNNLFHLSPLRFKILESSIKNVFNLSSQLAKFSKTRGMLHGKSGFHRFYGLFLPHFCYSSLRKYQ